MAMLSCNVSKVRKATLKGRKYLVANVTLIVPGVLNGSKGSLYYPPEEVAHPNNVDAWNGMPLVNGHPALNGVHVSARSPGVMERFGLGHVYNVRVNPKTGSLRGQAWFDVESLQRVEPRVLEALEAGRPVEVSTGLFTQDEPAPKGATYNGREYQYVARKYRPDHLAILIDQEGACSLRDGCGVMVENSVAANCGGKGGKPGPCPSQMTKAQWFSEGLEYVSQTADGERVSADPTGAPGEKTRKPRGDSLHKFHIRRAMAQGKKIPKEVLTDYPDISTNSNGGRAMAAKTMTKKDAVQFLTTNCDCWKAKGAKTTLNALPDETLNSLVASEQLATAVRNRLGEKAATLTVNQLAKTLADEEIELDADLDEGDEEVTENCGEDMAPPAAAAPVEDEEEEEEAAPPAPPFAKKKKKGPPMPPTGNSAPATPQRLTMAEWEAVAPLEVLDRDRRAKQVVNAEREKIITKLVANSAARSKDAKDQLRKALSTKSLDDLNLMSLLSTNRKESTERDSGRRAPDYGGMGHVYEEPTTNHDGINEDGSIADDEDGDPLGFPTLSVNWAQEVELSGGKKVVA